MNTKKTIGATSFIFATLAFANIASAQWTPLVRIPGLPPTGTVNLSMYLIGLYNFLLSVVGIVAVMMLIIGGMRYITAAGNQAALGDAKDIIQNAIFGLLLALLSWVFIATINPDVLYIKQPGSSFIATSVHGACYKEFNPATGNCTCIDGSPAPSPPYADADACDDACKAAGQCNLPDPTPCIAQVSPNEFTSLDFDKDPYNGKCKCIDDVFVSPIGGAIDCNEVCSDATKASDGEYHCYIADFRIGQMDMDGNTLPDDQARARKYALYQPNSYEHAYVVSASGGVECHIAFNAADYTTKFNDLISLSYTAGHDTPPNIFDTDCATTPTVDLLAPPSPTPVPGYYAPQVIPSACGVGDINSVYTQWEADTVNCRRIIDPESVICPVRLCADWVGGIHREKTLYVQMLKP